MSICPVLPYRGVNTRPAMDELGEFETIVPNWSLGDEFLTGDGRRFRIVGIVGVLDDAGVFNAFWKVRPSPTDAHEGPAS
jgi:hypothetical protein